MHRFVYTCMLMQLIASSSWSLGESPDQYDCVAPTGTVGKCSPFKDCALLWDLVIHKTPRPLTNEFVQYLQSLHCKGFSDGFPNVCCVDNHTTTAVASSSNVTAALIPWSSSLVKPIRIEGDLLDGIRSHANLPQLPIDTCGPVLPILAVSKGNATELFEYPWMALLQYAMPDGTLQFRCGGSLINDRYILTAAHCVSDPMPFSVRLGEHDLSNDPDCQFRNEQCADPVQDIAVERLIAHHRYNQPSRGSNDIGLIRMSHTPKLSRSVRPICLPFTNTIKNTELDWVTITGWGITENQTTSKRLLQATLPVITNEACQQHFRRSVRLQNAQMCAGGQRGIDSCKGDSGGPLMFRVNLETQTMVQYGVISLGVSYCSADNVSPGIYVRVSHYMTWILDNLHE